MSLLPTPSDPTLDAVDRAMVARQEQRHPRRLAISGLGNECERACWYSFRWATDHQFDADTLKRFEDGHHGEEAMIRRLRMVDGIEIHCKDPETGEQFAVLACEDHMRGMIDGAILGILQAPKTWHVWEHKVCNEKKFAALKKAVETHGEKGALREWDSTYFAQAVLYMHLTGMRRHYLTCSTPGSRATTSCRTDENPEEALRLLVKARRIIEAKHAPARISESETFYKCRWCDHAQTCHGDLRPLVNCRTCLHSSPVDGGQWHCDRWGKILSIEEQQAACPAHLYIPSMINGIQIDVAEDGSWVWYRLKDGSEWLDRAVQ